MKIEFDEKCPACHGTGLYVGMEERSGAAVVCQECKGTGCFHFVHTYEEFVGRDYTEDIKRVFQTNPGFCIGENERYKLEDFGGMPYLDWVDGKPFPKGSEMRAFVCPYEWYQNIDYDKVPKWKECWDNFGYTFAKCPNFPTKELCWEKFDEEVSNVT